jgi:type VII secretion-associated serine protease mycosin
MRAVRRTAAALCAATLGVLAATTLSPAPAQADSTRDGQWYLKTLDVAAAQKVTQGEGIVVAVIDTGVDANHPDLKGNVLPGVDFFDEKAKGQVDRRGHGTGMASLIAGHGHGPGNADGVLGIAPKAKILPVTVASKNTEIISPTAVAAGIAWAIDHGADVINVSLSSSSDPELEKAVEKAYDKNIILVAAVGNRSDAIIGWPAQHPGALAVTGTDSKGGVCNESIPAQETDIAAPCDDIVQAAPGGKYRTAPGTSNSTAIVSGSVALVRAKYPKLKSYDMFQRILETTKDAGEPGTDVDYGFGILDLNKALTGEPDGRSQKKASAEPTGDPYLYWEGPTESELFWTNVWSTIIVSIPVILIVVAVIFFRRRRKRRRAAEAAAAEAALPHAEATTGPAPAGDTAAVSDDSVWRPPTR